MKKENRSYVSERISEKIKEIRENKVDGKPTRTQEEYQDEILKEVVGISLEAFKKYEQGKRSCTISTFLQLATMSDIDLNEFKKEIAENKKYQEEKYNWEDCPAHIFINIAIEFDIDLNKLKSIFR